MRKSLGLVSEFHSEREEAPPSALKSFRKTLAPVFKAASTDLSDVLVSATVDPSLSVYETILEKEVQEEEKEPKEKEKEKPVSFISLAHDKKIQDKRRSVASSVLSFEVTKINQRGRRQPRVLRLSLVGIENVRSAADVTSSIFEYSSVQKVVLNSMSQFSLYYISGKHPYVYLSPVAIHIISEITKRVNSIRQRAISAGRFEGVLRMSIESEKARVRGERVRQLAGPAAAASAIAPVDRAVVIVWTGLNSTNSEERKAIYRFVNQQKKIGVDALQVRSFLDGMRFHFLKTRSKELEGNDISAWHSQEHAVIHAIDVTLENALIPLLLSPLLDQSIQANAARDAQFLAALMLFEHRTQEDLHVPHAFISPNGYAQSCVYLKELGSELLPSEVLDVVLRTVGSIYAEAGLIAQGNVMSGDDLLPVLIFVVLKSKVESPFAILQFAYDLCAAEELQGEAGYYLTTLESALMWIVSESQKSEVKK